MRVIPNRPFFPEEDRKEIARKVEEILESGMLSNGPYVKKLEDAFAARIGVSHAVAVSSGTAALEIIFRVLDVEGRDVIVPTNTFIATPNAVKYAGGTSVFSDIERETLCMDVSSLNWACDRRATVPKVAVIVHIGGTITPQIGEIKEFCDTRGIWLVEDAAHAHGSCYGLTPAGRFGIAAAFSFYPTKTMTAGEGGMIVTENVMLAEEARLLRDQGKSSYNPDVMCRFGYNWRMSELHALLGLFQLKRLDEFIQKREAIARIYDEALSGSLKLLPQDWAGQTLHSLYKYVVFLKELDRERLKKDLLDKRGVKLPSEVYAVPCHKQPIYRSPPYHLPVADSACASHICLPIHAAMTEEEALYVVKALKEAVS